jgi:hypothetical protein
MTKHQALLWLALCMTYGMTPTFGQEASRYDVVVYGGTSAGVAAAIQVARMGKTVVLIEPSEHIGGLTSGGLGFTDSGNKAVIGGISREFYRRLKKHYEQPAAWTFEKPEQYARFRADDDAMWTFEPKVAESVLRAMLAEHKVTVLLSERLDRGGAGVAMTRSIPPRLIALRTESGRTFQGQAFLDCTYEGDLMAAAGVTFHVGRESNEKYGETLNGVQKAKNTHNHRFVVNVDPYVTPGVPASGLLHGIDAAPYPDDDASDHRLQAYCFRMCMSNVSANRVSFPKPANYDETKYELLLRNFEAGDLRLPLKIDMMPNGKTDTNNNCAVSTDYIGQNHKYAEASYEDRERIIREHANYQQGLMWTLANHPRVPEEIRKQMSVWGLAADEFTDHGNWPHQIYVREARRLVGEYVMTEHDCRATRATPASVGMGSYNMDSHNCMRYVTPSGYVQNEGDIQVSPGGPYKISYFSLVPQRKEASNLLVPVCVSSSHISYGSIRMEPVFMVLGQSAATAAVMAMEHNVAVQDVPYPALRERLLKDGQVLEFDRPARIAAINPATLPGIVMDDDKARREGAWAESASVSGFVGTAYSHDSNTEKGALSVHYEMTVPETGRYEVRISYTANANRATNVPITIASASGEITKTVNQRLTPAIAGTWVSLGEVDFAKGVNLISISNRNTDGHVVADAVQLLPAK